MNIVKQDEYELALQVEGGPTLKGSIYDFVLPVVELDNQNNPIKIMGTCFSVCMAPVLMTASHVFLERNNEGIFVEMPNDRLGIIRFISGPNGISWEIFKVQSRTSIDPIDISLFHVRSTNGGGSFPNHIHFPLKENVSENMSVTAFGYPVGYNLVAGKQIFVSMVQSKGQILKVYEKQRDSVLMPYPCFESSIQIDAGHSGGPVIDFNTLSVVGINSRATPEVSDRSFASYIGKLLDLKICPDIEFNFRDGAPSKKLKGQPILALNCAGLRTVK